MATWTQLVTAYKISTSAGAPLKIATLAQWILESGRGKSDLARKHNNFGGLKYKARMRGQAEPVDYVASDGEDTYCKFANVDGFINGYWHFIRTGPYAGWEAFSDDPRGYIEHLKNNGYAADPGYVEKVEALFGEARDLLGSTADGASTTALSTASTATAGLKICVDPGHGMSNARRNVYDPGAVDTENGIQFTEAEIALRYGLTLKDFLRAAQIEVFMTRDDATDHAPVGQRAANAEQAGCDMFISLHLNAVESDQANGVEVLYGDEADRGLAETVREAVLRATGLRQRENKLRTDLAVLRFQGPAVLIELGFIGNERDRDTLLNPRVREAVCRNITAEVVRSAARARQPAEA